MTTTPLSLQLDFFCLLDRGDVNGPFGSRHVVVSAYRVRGPIDLTTLRRAFADVVERHEMLRTSIGRDPSDRCLRVQPPGPVRLGVHDLSGTPAGDRDRRAEDFLGEIETAEYPIQELPHLRAALGRFDDEDAVLVLVVHHAAADGWSMRVLIRDLATFYGARRGYDVPDPPPFRQYREYVAWQYSDLDGRGAERAYWRKKLDGARITTIRADRPLREEDADAYSDMRSLIGEQVTTAVQRFARTSRYTPFMVFLAAYNLLLRKLTGATDVVVGTFSSGREQELDRDTVGPFLNFLPLRTDLAGSRTFREVVDRCRETCLEAYTYDLPFPLIVEQAPGLLEPAAPADMEIVAFEALQFPPAPVALGGLEYAELRRRLISQRVACAIPNGALWALDLLPAGGTVSSLKFNANVFDAATMRAMADDYERILRNGVTAPDDPLPRW